MRAAPVQVLVQVEPEDKTAAVLLKVLGGVGLMVGVVFLMLGFAAGGHFKIIGGAACVVGLALFVVGRFLE